MKKVIISFMVMILFFTAFSTRADTILLQNGRTLHGEITGQADNYLEIRLGSGKMKLNRADVKSFEIKEPAEGYSKVELPALGKAEQKEEVTAKKSGETSKINFKAEYVKGKITVIGKSGLLPKTMVTVYFKRGDDVIAAKDTVTENGNFYVVFGPFARKLSAGEYTIEVRAESKDKKTISSSHSLVVGTSAQVKMSENEERQKLSESAKEVQSLYEELNETYAENKKDFDKKKWDEWSAGWFQKVNSQLQDYSRADIVSLYPKAHARLEACIHQLIFLQMAYSLDLTGQNESDKENEKVYPAKLEPKSLKDSIDSALTEAKEEILLAGTK